MMDLPILYECPRPSLGTRGVCCQGRLKRADCREGRVTQFPAHAERAMLDPPRVIQTLDLFPSVTRAVSRSESM
jgi:hypothetical protein